MPIAGTNVNFSGGAGKVMDILKEKSKKKDE
jgi:hypothetical protein